MSLLQQLSRTKELAMDISTTEAARTYGVFPSALHRLILVGRLEAQKDVNGHWRIRKESLERWNKSAMRPELAHISV
jgi:predicted site-specific integrase-resolvase